MSPLAPVRTLDSVWRAIKFENFTDPPDITTNIYGISWSAQTFTPSINHKITSVKLLLGRALAPGTITVSIRKVSGGAPTGGDLCSGTTNGNTLPTAAPWEWREIKLGSGYDLNAGTKYAIVVRATTGDATNYVIWPGVSGDPYVSGDRYSSGDSGDTWTGWLLDCNFEEWGIPFDTITRLYPDDAMVDLDCVLALPMNEGAGSIAYDKSGKGNHGTIVGATWADGYYKKCLSYDGDDYVNCGNSLSLHIYVPITIEVWFYPTDATRNNQTIICDRGLVGTNIHYEMRFQGPTLQLAYWFLDAGSVFHQWSSPVNSIILNAWNHAVITADGTNLKFYVNGIQSGSTQTVAYSPGTSDNSTTIGGIMDYFKGLIDKIGILTRVLGDSNVWTRYVGGRLAPTR